MYQRPCVPTYQKCVNFSFLCVNVPIKVPTCHTVCQCFKLACQGVKRRANFSTHRVNVPNVCQFFEYSSYEIFGEISILYYYIKDSTLYLLVSYLSISYVYVNFISILHFILKKSVWNFSFLLFLLLRSLVRNENIKRPGCVTINKGFLEFSTTKKTKQNKECK